MKKIFTLFCLAFSSVALFAHAEHALVEFASVIEIATHYASSIYHIAAFIAFGIATTAVAGVFYYKKKVLSFALMTLGLLSTVFGLYSLFS